MAKIKQGDTVVIAEREPTAQDVKSGLYYAHYAGLRGTILKLYGEEAAVLVERDSLPQEIRARHNEGEKAMRGKWLDNLSETARSGLNEREKSFSLNYAVLVSVSDLQPDRGQGKRAPEASAARGGDKQEAKAIAHAAQAIDPATGESDVARADKKAEGDSESGTDSAVKRATAAELDAAEEAFLQQRASANGSNGKGRKKAQ